MAEDRNGRRRNQNDYERRGFDWVPFLLGLLLGLALLAVLWFFTGSRRVTEGEMPDQIVYADRIWVTQGEAQTIDDDQMTRVAEAGEHPIYVRRRQSQPYTVIFIREGDNVYQPYQPQPQPQPEPEPTPTPTPTPTPQPENNDQPPDMARQRAERLPAEVTVGGTAWVKESLMDVGGIDLERYGNFTVNGFRVYREAGVSDEMLNNLYVGVGSGMYVRYRRRT